MNAHERVTHSHTMRYCSRAFTEGYASAPKYTPHSESSRGNFWLWLLIEYVMVVERETTYGGLAHCEAHSRLDLSLKEVLSNNQ